MTTKEILHTIPLIRQSEVESYKRYPNKRFEKIQRGIELLQNETAEEKLIKINKYMKSQNTAYGLSNQVYEFFNYLKGNPELLNKCIVDSCVMKHGAMNTVIVINNNKVQFMLDETIYKNNPFYNSENDVVLLRGLGFERAYSLFSNYYHDYRYDRGDILNLIEELDSLIGGYYIHLTEDLLDFGLRYGSRFKEVSQNYFDKDMKVDNIIINCRNDEPINKQRYADKVMCLENYYKQITKNATLSHLSKSSKLIYTILTNKNLINGLTLTDYTCESPIRIIIKNHGYISILFDEVEGVSGERFLFEHLKTVYHLTEKEVEHIWNLMPDLNKAYIILRNINNVCIDIGYLMK